MFDRKYPEGSKKNMGPFSKGAAFALSVFLMKVLTVSALLYGESRQDATIMLEDVFFNTMTSDAPIMFPVCIVFAKGSYKRMMWMIAGMMIFYTLLAAGAYFALSSVMSTDIYFQ